MADENTNVEVRMLVKSGVTEDSQFFDYRPSFFGDIIRIEWDLDTMEASLAEDAADYLIKHGYAIRLSPVQEPASVEQTKEPLVVETPVDEPSPPPSQTPPATVTQETASSGGKQRKKEKSR